MNKLFTSSRTLSTLCTALLALAACRSQPSAPVVADATAAVPIEGGARLPEPTTQKPTARAQAFLDLAAEVLRDPQSQAWLDAARAAGDSSTDSASAPSQPVSAAPLTAPLPAAVLRMLGGLTAWADSGEPIHIAEPTEQGNLALTVARVGLAIPGSLLRSDDPLTAAMLRLGHALRAPTNTAMAIIIGAKITERVADVLLVSGHQPVTEPFRTYALTERDALAFGRSSIAGALKMARLISRENVERELAAAAAPGAPAAPSSAPSSAPAETSTAADVLAYRRREGLPTAGSWLDDEFTHYERFWSETEALVASATSAAALATLLEQREAAAKAHPTSMLVRLVSDMVFSPRGPAMVHEIHQAALGYQRRLGAAAPAAPSR